MEALSTLSSNGHEKLKKLVNIKIVNFKKENRDPEKTSYLNKVKIVESL